MDKEYVIYIHDIEYYSALEKKEILPFATTWMNLMLSIMLSEIGQKEKDKYCMVSITCGIYKKKEKKES